MTSRSTVTRQQSRASWTGELCGFAPSLERLLMIAARCFGFYSLSNPHVQLLLIESCRVLCSRPIASVPHRDDLISRVLLSRWCHLRGLQPPSLSHCLDTLGDIHTLSAVHPVSFRTPFMSSWKRHDARRVPYIARFMYHMYPIFLHHAVETSQSVVFCLARMVHLLLPSFHQVIEI